MTDKKKFYEYISKKVYKSIHEALLDYAKLGVMTYEEQKND